MSAPDLAGLVSARLCHDLISPMGAIGNGLELLQMSRGAGTDELALINDSVATALAKLRFYRVAFGPADPEATQSLDEAGQITDAMFHGRFSVNWSACGTDMPRPTARLIYLAVLCLEKSLPMGGAVEITVKPRATGLRVEGVRMAPPEALWRHVTEGAPVAEWRSDVVKFALLRQTLQAIDQDIEADFTDTSAALRMTARSLMLA
jgi:histidine phosphotransferase ChpT